MGIFSKIFGKDESINNTVEVNPNSRNGNPDTIDRWKNKYEIMEEEGKNISWFDFQKSVDSGWPYPVATGGEGNALYGNKYALTGHAPDIVDLINSYQNGMGEDINDPGFTIFRDEEKAAFWIGTLKKGAERGNRVFQAVLVATNGYGGLQNGWLTKEEFDEYDKLYTNKLIQDAKDGDVNAQYAVAEMCLGEAEFGSDLRTQYAESAMNAGLSDAAYLRGRIYESNCFNNGLKVEFKDVLQYYLSAMPNPTGTMVEYISHAIDTGRQMGII